MSNICRYAFIVGLEESCISAKDAADLERIYKAVMARRKRKGIVMPPVFAVEESDISAFQLLTAIGQARNNADGKNLVISISITALDLKTGNYTTPANFSTVERVKHR